MPTVIANRTTLQNRRATQKFALRGVDLLTSKKNALAAEAVKFKTELSELEKKLSELKKKAMQSLILTHAIDGNETIDLISSLLKNDLQISAVPENIWGVRCACLKNIVLSEIGDFNVATISTRAVSAHQEFKEFAEVLIRYCFLSSAADKITHELDKTARRLSSLLNNFIPGLKREICSIEVILESRELEDIIRQKNTKKRKQNHGPR